MPRARAKDSEVHAYQYIKEQLKVLGWDVRNPERIDEGQVWTQNECLSNPAIKASGSFSFQGLAKPRMAKAWPGAQPMRRIAAAMLVSPPLRSSPKTTLRNAAIT